MLVRQRIRPQLELHRFAGCALAPFEVPGRACSVSGPESLAFPTGLGIVDASVHALGEESHGVGNAHDNELSGLWIKGFQGIRAVGCGDGNILAQAEGVELIDPVVIVGVGASDSLVNAFEGWAGCAIQGPTFGALLACSGRTVERPFALAAVDACEMSARNACPP